MPGIDNDRYGVGESDDDIERKESLKSDQPEPAPDAATGDGEIDVRTVDNTNYKLEEMNRKGARGKKICDISCLSGGILGTLGITACTVAVCMFFSGAGSPLYAISFPNGAKIGDVTSYVDADGRTNYDIELDNGGSGNNDKSSADAGGDSAGKNNGSEAGNKDHGPGSQPGSPDPGQDNKAGEDDNSPDRGVPDTGEPSGAKITPLMESELLRAQERRAADGGPIYSNTDLEIRAGGMPLGDICDIYGFSEEFVRAYNGNFDSVPDIIYVPDV